MDWTEIDGFFTEQDASDYRALYEMVPNGASTVEVGCFRGKSLACVADLILEKGLSVLAVDPWGRIENPKYDEPGVQGKEDWMFEDFGRTMADFGLGEAVTPMVALSEKAAKRVPDRQFDLVFIDGDHSYEAVKDDIEAWGPLVKEGGILSGHDWDEKGESWPGVHKAVVEVLGWPSFKKNIWAFRKVNGEFKALDTTW